MDGLFEDSSKKKPNSRAKRSEKQLENDVIHDALQEIFFPDGAGPDDHKRIGKVVRNLKPKKTVTPEEIRRRYANYPVVYEGLSPVSLEGFCRIWDTLRVQEKPKTRVGQWAIEEGKRRGESKA